MQTSYSYGSSLVCFCVTLNSYILAHQKKGCIAYMFKQDHHSLITGITNKGFLILFLKKKCHLPKKKCFLQILTFAIYFSSHAYFYFSSNCSQLLIHTIKKSWPSIIYAQSLLVYCKCLIWRVEYIVEIEFCKFQIKSLITKTLAM